MDRLLIYPFEQPQETDLLNAQKFALLGLAQLAAAALGSGPLLQGLACTPGTGLTVSVSPGQIYQSEVADATAFSSLAADSRTVLKQGVVWTPTVLNCPAPGSAGQSINYLVEVGFLEADTNPVVLPFYDASNPTVPYNGPNGSGVPSNTIRSDECVVQVKAGTAATTGTQTTPAADAGFIGAYVVTVAYGAASITTGNIAIAAGAPFISAGIGQTFQVCAGNPNGQLAGTAAAAVTAFPTVAYDIAHNALWVCTTTGTASTAVWTEVGQNTPWPFWCGTSTGSANAQTVTPPPAMQAFPTGTGLAWVAGYSNTAAATLTVGSYGTFAIRKEGPSGPVALTGGEIVVGNIISARFDGTYIQLTATEMGTAALKNTGNTVVDSGTGSLEVAEPCAGTTTGTSVTYTSSNRGQLVNRSNSGTNMSDTLPSGMPNGWYVTVANRDASAGLTFTAPGGTNLNGVNGGSLTLTCGQIVSFSADSSANLWTGMTPVPKAVAKQLQYINSTQALGPGGYLIDTSAGPITITLESSPAVGDNYTLVDMLGTWGQNNLIVNPNGATVNGLAGNLICDTAGAATAILEYKSGTWTIN